MTAASPPTPHESAALHVTGGAAYTDDLPDPRRTLHLWLVPSPVAAGRLLSIDRRAALAVEGVVAIYTAADVPGRNRIGPIVHDEPLLAEETLSFLGQPVAVVAAVDRESARLGAAAVKVEVAGSTPCLGIDEALAAGAFLNDEHVIVRGSVDEALATAHLVVAGEVRTPAQDHFYLECHAALCVPEESGTFTIHSSTQHPTEIQREAAAVLGVGHHRVTCVVPRLGGGFGGKESQATSFGAFAALVSFHTGRPARIRLDRGQDMGWTGKRHPFLGRYRTGFDAAGRIVAHDVSLFSDGGWSLDLSGPVLDRALFHLDNACFIPNLRFRGRVCRTNTPSNTAFRGFGGPQGMAVTHEALRRGAAQLGLPIEEVFARNLYGAQGGGDDVLPYGQRVVSPRGGRMLARWTKEADIEARRGAVAAWNAANPFRKRGISAQVVQFGISFTNSLLNQAGALVLLYADGTVQLNHGGTEMGQGLHSKMRTIAATTLGVPEAAIRVMTTSTEKVPNTSATAASSGSDLNGQAVREACETLRRRVLEVAVELLRERGECVAVDELRTEGAVVLTPLGTRLPWAMLCTEAWLRRRSLAAVGYYRTPGIAYDRAAGRGTPFFYFAWGVAFADVEVCGLTGESRIQRIDVLHDCGRPILEGIDRGQVEGALVQGIGWLTNEDVVVDGRGAVRTRGPSTYKIPTVGDVPRDLRVTLLEDAAQPGVIAGSKAVGEPPFMLALAVSGAIQEAVAAFSRTPADAAPASLPLTPESILRAATRNRGERWG